MSPVCGGGLILGSHHPADDVFFLGDGGPKKVVGANTIQPTWLAEDGSLYRGKLHGAFTHVLRRACLLCLLMTLLTVLA